jgi:hypothetical protein
MLTGTDTVSATAATMIPATVDPNGMRSNTFLQNPVGNSQQILSAFLANPSAALVAYGPFLFFVGYQVVSNTLGWPTWAMILSSPFLLPLTIGLGINALLSVTAPGPRSPCPPERP